MTRNGPGLHQDVTKTPHSPGTRTYKDQEFTRMLPGCYKECRSCDTWSVHSLDRLKYAIVPFPPTITTKLPNPHALWGRSYDHSRRRLNPILDSYVLGVISKKDLKKKKSTDSSLHSPPHATSRGGQGKREKK
ncbi:hypothetical protein JOM56_014674 [Amanita muscaria]